MTTEVINNLFGIKESFELPQALLAKLLDKAEKDKLCDEVYQEKESWQCFKEFHLSGMFP